MAAGMAMGSVYKLYSGPKAMISGGAVGGVLGFTGGVSMWLLQKLSGETVEQRWLREFEHLNNLQKARDAEVEKNRKKANQSLVSWLSSPLGGGQQFEDEPQREAGWLSTKVREFMDK
jgi:frataxin-like iron-binding protein CyaY